MSEPIKIDDIGIRESIKSRLEQQEIKPKNTKVLFLDAPFHTNPDLMGQTIDDFGHKQEVPRGALSVAMHLKENGFDSTVLPMDAFMNVEILKKREEFFNTDVPESTEYLQRKVIAEGYLPEFLVNVIDREIEDVNLDVIGVSYMFSGTNPITKEMIHHIKERRPDIKVIVGGNAATFDESSKTELLDPKKLGVLAIVDYEGELTTGELMENVEKNKINPDDLSKINGIEYWDGTGVAKTDRRERATTEQLYALDYDLLTLPEGVDIGKFNHYVLLARGCKGNCKFCTSPAMWEQKLSSIGLKNFEEELTNIVRKTDTARKANKTEGKNIIGILDDDILLKINPEATVFEEIEPILSKVHTDFPDTEFAVQARVSHLKDNPKELLVKMKKSGINMIFLGIESGSQEILNETAKGLNVDWIEPACKSVKDADIDVGAFWIIGLPGSTLERERESLSFLGSLVEKGLVDELESHVFFPLPGTVARKELEIAGTLDSDIDSKPNALFSNEPVFERKDNNGNTVLSKKDIKGIFAETQKIVEKLRQKKLSENKTPIINEKQ